jgi:hypothetical protein
MAEVIALLGATAAGLQCAEVGVQILMLGLSLRSKLQDAPDQVKRWLTQIEQLVALAELIRSDTDLLPCSARTAAVATWIETAILECTGQAQTLKGVFKDMLQEVDDGKGKKIWKSILTVKRETRIASILQEIERQKSMLGMWLGQNNLRQLKGLHHIIKEVQDVVGKVDGNVLHVEQTFGQELQSLSTAFYSSSRATASEFESLKNLSASNVESFRQQMQQHHGLLQGESSELQLQLDSMVRAL